MAHPQASMLLIQSLQRGLGILEFVARNGAGVTATQVNLQVPAGEAVLVGTLTKATFLGPFTDCVVTAEDLALQVQVPGALAARRGERVCLTVEPDACTLLPGPASAHASAKPLTNPTGS